MLEVAEADFKLEAGFVRAKGAPGMPQIAEFVDANDRCSGLHDGGVGRVARAPSAPSSP